MFVYPGKCISTKAVGRDAREDITSEYKSQSGSVLGKANTMNTLAKTIQDPVRAFRKGECWSEEFLLGTFAKLWLILRTMVLARIYIF